MGMCFLFLSQAASQLTAVLPLCVCVCVWLTRSTIERHLLSSATDPFSRATLCMEQLQPATEVISRMQQWMQQHKEAAAAAKQQQAAQAVHDGLLEGSQ